jgi:tetratricopeptide (TPR) repeat protein
VAWRLLLVVLLAEMVVPRPAWSQSVPEVRHVAAWHALDEHRYGEAAALFAGAALEHPEDAALWFGAGVAALMRGLNGEAQTSFQRALTIEPDLTDAAILLGHSLYRDGQVGPAIAAYERALLRAPDHPELTSTLSRWRSEVEVEASFLRLRGSHFEVRYLPADDALASRALDVLEAAHERLTRELTATTFRSIEVVVYSPNQFKAVTKLPAWAVGIYDGRIKVPLGGSSPSDPDLERVLEHELVHAIVAAIAGPTVPAWLNEGLATAFEPGGAQWAREVEAATASALPRGFRDLMPAEARTAYAASTRIVQRLLTHHGTAGVVGLLRSIGRGVPFSEAFHETVGMTVEAFASGAHE